jgi:hypothetical protein
MPSICTNDYPRRIRSHICAHSDHTPVRVPYKAADGDTGSDIHAMPGGILKQQAIQNAPLYGKPSLRRAGMLRLREYAAETPSFHAV